MNKQSFLLITLFSLCVFLAPSFAKKTGFRSLNSSSILSEDSQRLLIEANEKTNTTAAVDLSGGVTTEAHAIFIGASQEPEKEMNIEHETSAESLISFGEDGSVEADITLNGNADVTMDASARVFDAVNVDLQANIDVEFEVQMEIDIDRKSGKVSLDIEVDVNVESDVEVQAYDDEGNHVESYVTSDIEVRVDVEVEMEVEDREGGQDINIDVDVKIQADVYVQVELDWDVDVDDGKRLLRGN